MRLRMPDSTIGFVVLKAFPFGQSLDYSFTDMNFFKSGTTFVGLQNYITAFTITKITKALIKIGRASCRERV